MEGIEARIEQVPKSLVSTWQLCGVFLSCFYPHYSVSNFCYMYE